MFQRNTWRGVGNKKLASFTRRDNGCKAVLFYVNILHFWAVGRNQKVFRLLKVILEQFYGASSSEKVVPNCSTVYFPVVIGILVFESDIFNY